MDLPKSLKKSYLNYWSPLCFASIHFIGLFWNAQINICSQPINFFVSIDSPPPRHKKERIISLTCLTAQNISCWRYGQNLGLLECFETVHFSSCSPYCIFLQLLLVTFEWLVTPHNLQPGMQTWRKTKGWNMVSSLYLLTFHTLKRQAPLASCHGEFSFRSK